MKKNLYESSIGEKSKIEGFVDEYTESLLFRMGIYIGKYVKCISKFGPLIISADYQTIAIDKNLAKKIYIKSQND